MDKLTTISEFPDEIKKHIRCQLLHVKTPYFDATVNEIKYYCKECHKERKHDDDPPKDQEASEPA